MKIRWKRLNLLVLLIIAFGLTACRNSTGVSSESNTQSESATAIQSTAEEKESTTESQENQESKAKTQSHILVAYFSLAGEQYSVGVVKEGNTAIIADMIAKQTGADIFEIKPSTPYPTTFKELLNVARKEIEDKIYPEIAGSVDNMDQYDTIFIGYPIWEGNMPNIVTSFLKSYNLSGKTIVPFCTHGGSGLADTEAAISDETGATMKSGLAIPGVTAQNDRETSEKEVKEWLRKGGFME